MILCIVKTLQSEQKEKYILITLHLKEALSTVLAIPNVSQEVAHITFSTNKDVPIHLRPIYPGNPS